VSSALRLAGVSKRYWKIDDTPTLAGRALAAASRDTRQGRQEFWALRDIDLDVAPGERVGIIGRNGAGKSTMLRMLAGITAPTTGSVTVRGRVAPLLSVGVGFHPELTGRENVYVNGTVLGLSRQEITRRFDEIVDFAGIERFLDTPVKFYSSGMFVRLGFSVAVIATPDVLIVDEVLAVGDVAFQQKCFERMQAVAESGTTVLVVSHNIAGIRQICPRTVLMHHGQMLCDGPTDAAVTRYYELLVQPGSRDPDDAVVVRSLALESPEQPVPSGADTTFAVELEARRDVAPYVVWIGIGTPGLAPIYSEVLHTGDAGIEAGGTARVGLSLPLPLPDGDYVMQVSVRDAESRAVIARGGPLPFRVAGRPDVTGLIDLCAQFSVERAR